MSDKRPNIIYINPDEMRADALGCHGHPAVRTPHIDRLAAEGVRFEQCHVQHTVCTPSRCSFMTGWYPHVHGHRTLWHPLQAHEPNTLRYLKEAGYEVTWIGKNDLLAPDVFASSVSQVYDWHGAGAGSAELFTPDEPGFWSFLRGPLSGHSSDHRLYERAIEFLRRRRPDDPPFMLYLPSPFPHCPYTVPQPWYDMIDPDSLPPLRAFAPEGKPDYVELIRRYRRLAEVDEALLRKVMAVYLGMVCYVDHLVGMLMEALDATGLAESTAVFLFSDHGDWAGDYGLVEKWPSALDDCLTHVPLIVRSPGCAAGHVVREPVECFDIMPTTLELAGVEARHTHQARSLTAQLRGAPGDPERAVFAEGGYDTHEPLCFEGRGDIAGNSTGIYAPKGRQQQEHPESVCRATMIRTRTHKLVRRPAGRSELYDLTADPQELVNLWDCPEHAAVRQTLTERLLDWGIHTADVVPWQREPRGFPPGLAT